MNDTEMFLKLSTLAQSTRAIYRHYLGEFHAWLDKAQLAPATIQPENLIDWINDHPAWSSSTKHNAAASVRAYYTWRYGASHPVNQARIRRSDPGPQRTLDWDELTRLMGALEATPAGIRNLALIALAVDTGLRASELCRLDLRYLDTKNRSFSVIIKGGDWGQGCYFDYTASCMTDWLAIRANYAAPGVKNVFVSIGGTRPGTAMCKDGLRTLFRRLSEKAGLNLVSPHAMRRTFATLSSKAGAPTRVIQVAGRWKDISMVERYTKALKPADLAPFSPINRLMGVTESSPVLK